MNWKNILTIYGKELCDMLRDRRTLISMIVIPTVAIPGLFALVTAISFRVQQEVAATPPTIMVLGGEDSPESRGALLKNFLTEYVLSHVGQFPSSVPYMTFHGAIQNFLIIPISTSVVYTDRCPMVYSWQFTSISLTRNHSA